MDPATITLDAETAVETLKEVGERLREGLGVGPESRGEPAQLMLPGVDDVVTTRAELAFSGSVPLSALWDEDHHALVEALKLRKGVRLTLEVNTLSGAVRRIELIGGVEGRSWKLHKKGPTLVTKVKVSSALGHDPEPEDDEE
jgi:hypothetical protein